MAVRILSIDGGGLRGLLPLWVLREIEAYTDKKVFDCFDFFAGSSTGGIISAGLTIPKDATSKAPKLTIENIIQLYEERGKDIFPSGGWFTEKWKKCPYSYPFRPMFSNHGMKAVLEEFFQSYTIRDCLKPIMIPTYSITRMQPLWFLSRITHPSERNKIDPALADAYNVSLVDALMAATAAPTYLPAYPIIFGLDTNTNDVCIDGGIYQNNPTNAALVELFRNMPEYSQKFQLHNSPVIDLDDLFVLSIGTGRFNKSKEERLQLTNAGKLKWAQPAIDISMWGNAQAVDFQTNEWLDFGTQGKRKINYLRINFDLLESNFSDMTNASQPFRDYYLQNFEKQFLDNRLIRSQLAEFLEQSGIYRL